MSKGETAVKMAALLMTPDVSDESIFCDCDWIEKVRRTFGCWHFVCASLYLAGSNKFSIARCDGVKKRTDKKRSYDEDDASRKLEDRRHESVPVASIFCRFGQCHKLADLDADSSVKKMLAVRFKRMDVRLRRREYDRRRNLCEVVSTYSLGWLCYGVIHFRLGRRKSKIKRKSAREKASRKEKLTLCDMVAKVL
ncbi:hypothetical protein BIW11_13424 [Tropilaelaps mercedesae]|uniref:Uncharacterized protein n=1 Tax=Tropilaelaps mercedesae TaxID=418985 RepID=A0A1V9X1Z1_9ACAR|nr:hypothetical protein BIW11_13424 [Tropilaelaps mercedesae]